ncbi:hypothetical protein [Poseidonibacter lekithochrous]|uniref:hypothetical protein n=1 Tax=Poseidonibacter lekithochrous TaxID=1904463 RepID=UPI0008FC3E28|nr:hypothetical protein [Poseidonibacter lekithochrous]QKJ22323.1 hypothetical protein ALEK_1043 [Poseidonibacter lekithochrous]
MFALDEDEASSYLDMENEDLIVSDLLNKYKISISTQNSFIYNINDDYNSLTNYIGELYINEEEIPNDIQKQIEHNVHYRNFLISNLEKRMDRILCDKSTIIFKEIVTIVNILSFGKDYKIFESYDFYNLEQMAQLFRDYEKKLIDLKQTNTDNFLITFKHYTTLIEVLNELCAINSIDVLRKKTINPIIELLTETINIVKFNITLNDKQINILNNILGKLLFYYSHIPYINTKNKSAQYLISEFSFNVAKLSDGFTLSKNTNFANDSKSEHEYYKIYLNSLTTSISNLIYKLEDFYDEDDYLDISNFISILDVYKEMVVHKETKQFASIKELKIDLLDNYVYVYKENENISNCMEIVTNFLENKEFDSSNMQILLYIILFSEELNEDKLIKILSILLTLTKFENDYHEFHKLQLIDNIIKKLVTKKDERVTKLLNIKLVEYIEVNKIASHLMSIYSKIYLSLSMFNSSLKDKNSIELTKYYYYKYLSINGKELLENEYENINKIILINIAKNALEEMNIDLKISEKDKLLEIGSNLITKYAEEFEILTKYNINQKLSNIVTDIFTNEGLDNDTLNSHIESFISKDIFHGLVFVSIDGLCERKCRLTDLGYVKVHIPLIDGYTLKMAYSSVYKHIFTDLYENNKDYIKQNLINLLVCYLKSTPLYFDSVTKLQSSEKLKKDLLEYKEGEIVFLEICLENLNEFNTKYTYEKGNDIFKAFSNSVNTIVPTYRLQGPRIGLIVSKDNSYEEIIKSIKNIKIKYENKMIDLKLAFAVSYGDKSNIILKSEHAMTLALKKKEKFNIFK